MKLCNLITVRLLFIAAAVILVILFSSVNPRTTESSGPSLRYNPQTQVLAYGIAEDVELVPCPLGPESDTHVMLKTEKGFFTIHLGPARFVQSYRLRVIRGDRLEVLGSAVHYHGADDLIARELTWNNQTFIFRRPDGTPLWED
jgi:hypothetical protein